MNTGTRGESCMKKKAETGLMHKLRKAKDLQKTTRSQKRCMGLTESTLTP